MTAVSTLVLSLVLAADLPQNVLLDFSATWCGPCQQMKPVVAELERQGLPVAEIDIDEHPDLARKFGVQSVPTFVLLIDGRVADREVGITSRSRLYQMASRAQNALREQQSRGRHRAQTQHSSSEAVIRANNAALSADHVRPSLAEPDISCCVRIRVRDSGGISYGSGTIIASHPGRSIVLTCGHIFRRLGRGSQIKVDVFHGKEVETFDGRVVCYDLEADVGLLTIDSLLQLPSAAVLPEGSGIRVGEPVISFGCSGGEPPTRQSLHVTALNRYLGPDNVECSGVPVEGRSGGGLFNSRGELVGVCIAADRQERRGLYAGPKAIHALLRKAGLEYLIQRRAEPAPSVQLARSNDGASSRNNTGTMSASGGGASAADRFARPLTVSPLVSTAAQPCGCKDSVRSAVTNPGFSPTPGGQCAQGAQSGQLFQASHSGLVDKPSRSPEDVFLAPRLAPTRVDGDANRSTKSQPASQIPSGLMLASSSQPANDGVPAMVVNTADGLRQTFSELGEAEVVCIIRPLRDPTAVSRVVIIRRASPKFVADLLGEMQRGERQAPTASTASSSDGGFSRPSTSVWPAAYTANEVRASQLQFQQLRVRRFERATER